MNLECSSRGNRNFSALYAKVRIFGYYDSIENYYQDAKGFNIEPARRKGAVPDFMAWKDTRLHRNELKNFYDMLWCLYLSNNEELYHYAKGFDTFSDMFRTRNAVVCQADTIRDIVSMGLEEYFAQERIQNIAKIVLAD